VSRCVGHDVRRAAILGRSEPGAFTPRTILAAPETLGGGGTVQSSVRSVMFIATGATRSAKLRRSGTDLGLLGRRRRSPGHNFPSHFAPTELGGAFEVVTAINIALLTELAPSPSDGQPPTVRDAKPGACRSSGVSRRPSSSSGDRTAATREARTTETLADCAVAAAEAGRTSSESMRLGNLTPVGGHRITRCTVGVASPGARAYDRRPVDGWTEVAAGLVRFAGPSSWPVAGQTR
jgi:hypothetical protein